MPLQKPYCLLTPFSLYEPLSNIGAWHMTQWPAWCQRLPAVDYISTLLNRNAKFTLFKAAKSKTSWQKCSPDILSQYKDVAIVMLVENMICTLVRDASNCFEGKTIKKTNSIRRMLMWYLSVTEVRHNLLLCSEFTLKHSYLMTGVVCNEVVSVKRSHSWCTTWA